jgi:hypothetical protein
MELISTFVATSNLIAAKVRLMLDGLMLVWFVLTAVAVIFVAFDIRSTPESPVMKWAFVLVALYTGPFGAFLCPELS